MGTTVSPLGARRSASWAPPTAGPVPSGSRYRGLSLGRYDTADACEQMRRWLDGKS